MRPARRASGLSTTLLLTVACVLAGASALHAADRTPRGGPVEWIPVRDPIERDLDLLRAAGLADTAASLDTRPLARRTVAAVVARARRLHPESRDPSLVRLERAFGRELIDWGWAAPARYTTPLATVAETDSAAEDDSAWPTRLRLFAYGDGALDITEDLTQFEDRSRVGGRLNLEHGGLLLHFDMYAGRVVNASQFSDVLVTGSDFMAYSEDTYGSIAAGGFDATFGRMGFAWGPGARGSLLWSSSADPITMLTFGATLFGHFRVMALHGDVDASQGARIAGHRLEWFPSPRLTVGVSEAARYTSAHWEPLYVAGLLPYTFVQRVLDQDQYGRPGASPDTVRNNVMASFDASWTVKPGAQIYGEFLLDDQGLKVSGYPTRIGYQAGTLVTGAAGAGGRWRGRLEYARVYNYVYSTYYGEDFIHHEKPIGYPEGPDSRSWYAEGGLGPNPDWDFHVAGAQVDLGEGTLGNAYDPSSGDATGSTLSGVVETTRTLEAGTRWTPRDGVDLSLDVVRSWIDNAGHVQDDDTRTWTLRLGARLRK